MPETLEQVMGWNEQGNPNIKYHYEISQHTEQWDAIRCGVITASVMKNLLKKKKDKKTGEVSYSVPDNETTKAYLFELAAQRINGYAGGDNFQSYAMERGLKDEVDAFNLYSENYEQLKTCGFVTNDQHGVLLGFSPDGLTALNDDGQIEVKGRAEKFQTETIYYDELPDEFEVQVQTGLIVTKREWCDFISYRDGMPMYVKRVFPDDFIQYEIIKAAQKANIQINEIVSKVQRNIEAGKFLPTQKRVEDISA